MDKFIIKLTEKQCGVAGISEDKSYVKSITLAFRDKFKAEYGTVEEAYIFTTKKLADSIAPIVKGKVIGETRQKKARKKVEQGCVALNPPTLKEVLEYCKSKNLNLDVKEVYEYYTKVNWVDKNGNEIVNWKLKFNTISQYNDRKGIKINDKKVKAEKKENNVKDTKIEEIKKKIQENKDLIERIKDKNSAVVKRAEENIKLLEKQLESVNK